MGDEFDCWLWEELVFDILGLIFRRFFFDEILNVVFRVCKLWVKVVKGFYCW